MTCTHTVPYFQMRKKLEYNSLPYLCLARVVLPQLYPWWATFLLDNLYLQGLAREQESQFVKAGFTKAQLRDPSEFIVRNEHKIEKPYSVFRSFPGLKWSEDSLTCECSDHKTTAYSSAHVHECMWQDWIKLKTQVLLKSKYFHRKLQLWGKLTFSNEKPFNAQTPHQLL